MKSLLEHAQSSAKKNRPKEDNEQILKAYCDGYCAGVQEAIDKLKKMPEYFDARDYIEFKMGVDIY